MRYNLKIILILFSFVTIITACTDDSNSTQHTGVTNNDTITELIENALILYNNGDYFKSLQLYDTADLLLKPKTDTAIRIRLLFNKTEVLKQQGEFEKCINNYYKAVVLAQLTEDSTRLALAYYNISAVHFLMKNLDDAEKYNLLAQSIYKNTEEEGRLMNCFILYASICKQNNDIPKAKKYLNQAIAFYEKGGDELNLSICMNNYGNLLREDEKNMEAIAYFIKAAEISERLNNPYSLAIKLGNIGDAYLWEDQLENAKTYIDSSLQIARRIDAKVIILLDLKRLANYYKEKNDLEKVLEILEEQMELNTELFKLETSNIIQSVEEKNKNELDLLRARNKMVLLKKEQERTQLIVYVFTFISLLVVAVFYILYKKQMKIRVIDKELYNKEREALAIQSRLDNTELKAQRIKKQQLEKELEYKRKELMAFSLSLSEREKLFEKIKSVFSKINTLEIPRKEVLLDIKTMLSNKKGDGSAEIYSRIEELNSSFHFNLKTNYPDLTDDDVRLASLLVIGLSSKEVANILTIEPKSVDMKRYRLKKKFAIDSESDLRVFLSEI